MSRDVDDYEGTPIIFTIIFRLFLVFTLKLMNIQVANLKMCISDHQNKYYVLTFSLYPV